MNAVPDPSVLCRIIRPKPDEQRKSGSPDDRLPDEQKECDMNRSDTYRSLKITQKNYRLFRLDKVSEIMLLTR